MAYNLDVKREALSFDSKDGRTDRDHLSRLCIFSSEIVYDIRSESGSKINTRLSTYRCFFFIRRASWKHRFKIIRDNGDFDVKRSNTIRGNRADSISFVYFFDDVGVGSFHTRISKKLFVNPLGEQLGSRRGYDSAPCNEVCPIAKDDIFRRRSPSIVNRS